MKKHTHPQAPRLNQIAALLATSSFTAMLALSAHAQSEAPAAAAAAPATRPTP